MLPSWTPHLFADRRRRVGRLRVWLVAGLLVFVVVLAGIGLSPSDRDPVTPPASNPSSPISSRLGRGRTILDALLAHGLHQQLAARIIQAFRPLVDFRRLKPEDSLEFHHDATGGVAKVVVRQSLIDIVEATADGDTWSASRRDVPVDRRVLLVAGTLTGNLFDSVEALGERPQLVLDFAEIFAWDFDFAGDSQPGDRFRMLVEKVFTGEQFVKYGRILAAEYESEGKVHTGIHFREKEGSGYYTPSGESLRRAFLKSPLEFTRISSGFSRWRRHPILGSVRPHLAVDYAAPLGTPVWAVADGTVETAGWSGGNGNTVIVRHRANFKTMYNHLSRFGSNIRAGVAVRQRQVIGYVGSTGLSTGPHLDYRVIKDGSFVNPLKQMFLPGKPISPSTRNAFVEARDALLRQLHEADEMKLAAAPKS
jgi:murein DD-endopeptidase MepM/ murein hydrolase activator NlpD